MSNDKNREDARVIEEKEFRAFYNSRDLILYALSVGFGLKGNCDKEKTQEDDIRYLYEQHPHFTAVPAFCLALSFWASQHPKDATSYSIPPFPPPSMTATVTIPTRYINSNINRDISAYPILHMWQSIKWHRNLPVPVAPSSSIETRMMCKILTIAPKKIGTFVTSETEIHEVKSSSRSRGSLLCTLQSTALVLGIPREIVIPVDITQKKSTTNASSPRAKTVPVPQKEQRPDFEWSYETTPTQSLLYRLASGDSNRIHVLGDDMLSKKLKLGEPKPILHGLCTFGVATRAILQFAASDRANREAASSLVLLEGRFSKPVFIGDTLMVKVWDMSHLNRESDDIVGQEIRTVAFRVLNLTTGEVAVDNGYAELSKDGDVMVPDHVSRL